MTQRDEHCPTCGSRLTALHRVELRRCNACRRNNPAGFLYCGYCAAPMEHTEIRAKLAEVPAPPGGWPNLAGDLTEVKFFLKQGQLDEAYDLLSILQRRYPGHPELADFATSTSSTPKPDADVEHLVDTVLADSSTLGGKLPRRRATPWDAPTSKPVERRGRKLTNAHEVVRAALIEDVDEVTSVKAKVVVADYAMNPRPARKPVPKVEHTSAFAAIPPKRIPKVRLRQGKMPQPKLLRDSAEDEARLRERAEAKEQEQARAQAQEQEKARAQAEAVAEIERRAQEAKQAALDAEEARRQKAKADAKTKPDLPRVPRGNYSEEGRPATVHMPPVRADDVHAADEVEELDESDLVVDEEPEAVEAEPAKKDSGPQHTVAVDVLQPAAPYAAKQNRTVAVDALQPPKPFEGEAPDPVDADEEPFEARKEQIKRATSKTGRGRRVTGANKIKVKGDAKRKRPRGVPPRREPEGEENRRSRGTAFGAGVLSRFGR